MGLVSFRAGQPITSGNFLRVTTNGLAYPATCGNKPGATAIGVAINSAEADDVVLVNKDYIYDGLPALTPGEKIYLALDSGQHYTSYEAFDVALSGSTLSGMYLTELGTAITTEKLHVQIKLPVFINR